MLIVAVASGFGPVAGAAPDETGATPVWMLAQAGFNVAAWAGFLIPLALICLAALWWGRAFVLGTRRDVSLLPWWAWLAAAAAVFIGVRVGALFGASIAYAAGFEGTDPPYPLPLQGAIMVGAYVVAIGTGLALIAAVGSRARPDRLRAAGLAMRVRDFFLGLAWFVLVIPLVHLVSIVSSAVATRVSDSEPPRIAHDTLRQIVERHEDPWAWVLAAGAVIGAPITEELTYRVFIQSGLLALVRRTWLGVLITSAVFAAVHYSVATWHAMPALFILGLAMGLAYERTRAPLVPITMHALFNASMIALAVGSERNQP